MFGLHNFSIDFLSGSLPVIIPAFIILIGLSILLYLKTNPPLPLYLRIIFILLRITAVSALLLALSEPVISYTREFSRLPKISLLLDESKSMEKQEMDLSRRSRRDSLLSSQEFNSFSKNIDLTTYYFGGNLSQSPDKIEADKTSLGDVIKQLENIELGQASDHWLLFSDGNSNSGLDPQIITVGFKNPIHTINLAQNEANFDIGINNIDYNPIMFSGQPGEINLKFNWQNADTNKIMIQLKDSKKILNQTNFTINQPEGFADISIKYTPTEPGQKILNINIPSSADEENKDNNTQSFSIKILKSRLSILLVCENPDYEIGFLKRFFEQSEKYEVDLKVLNNKAGNLTSQFPNRQTELNRYDLVILYDIDVNKFSSKKDLITSYLADKGGSLWVLMGNNFSRSSSSQNWISSLLPFYPSNPRSVEYINFQGVPAETNLYHPAIRLGDNQTEIRKIWTELPPFRSLVRCNTIATDATILLYAASSAVAQDNLPIMGYKRLGAGKILAVAALPFWNFGFVNPDFGQDNSIYSKFIEGVASWLTVTDDLEPLRILPDKSVYNQGEAVSFKGFAYDLGFRPIPNVSGKIKLENKNSNESIETDLISSQIGNFTAEFFNLKPGEYNYSGQLKKENRLLKEVSGSIFIESFSLEEFDQSGNSENLKAIAKNSGGRYFRTSDFSQAIQSIDTKPISVKINNEFKLWNKFWLLLIIVGMLVIEWLLRKINQLI